MKFLIPILALFSFGQAGSQIKADFDKLLADDNIVLKGDLYKIRLAAFTIGYSVLEDKKDASLELMYTIDELSKQNGAKLVQGLTTDAGLQKREENVLLEMSKRGSPFYDGRKYAINKVVNQQTCGNCYLHTFVAALEIAYTKATGELVKFSEQELTDCYNNGCEGGDYRMVAITMSYLDKLSRRDSYVTNGYLDGQFTCRTDTTPDALDKVKVVDYVEVTTATIKAAIIYYGSVMTCMKWSSTPGTDCYMTAYKKGIVDYPEVRNGCDHAVLIVGYGPGFYIVRNSHGHSWGEDGYFLIKSGKNVCGIEDNMAAVIVELRGTDKVHNSNGCPLDKPILCKNISACTTAGHKCMTPSSKKLERLVTRSKEYVGMEEEVRMSLEEDVTMEYEEVEERAVEMKKEDEGDEKRRLKRVLEKRVVIADRRASEGEEFENVKRCVYLNDRISQCKDFQRVKPKACKSAQFKFLCPTTCKVCEVEDEQEEIKIPEESTELMGKCFTPKINNGRVWPRSAKMKPGQELKVKCRRGYTLIGETVECLIQDILTNPKTKDARLLPACIKLGENALVGNGSMYIGTKNTYTDTRIERDIECDSWNKDVLRGVLTNIKDGTKYLVGNHNYCRNPIGDQPVPFCLSSAGGAGKIVYCFKYPGCEVCGGAVDQRGLDYCVVQGADAGKCDYKDMRSRDQVDFFWETCKATCCAKAGCTGLL